MLATVDPDVFIESQSVGYIRYWRQGDNRRWEVKGTCVRKGDCMIGAVVGGVEITDKTQLATLALSPAWKNQETYDTPVTPEFEGCCDFSYVELPPGPYQID